MTTPITNETRAEGLAAVAPAVEDIRSRVLAALEAQPAGLLAEDIAEQTGITIHNVRSRLTELKKIGDARVIGKGHSKFSGVRVAVWAPVLKEDML